MYLLSFLLSDDIMKYHLISLKKMAKRNRKREKGKKEGKRKEKEKKGKKRKKI